MLEGCNLVENSTRPDPTVNNFNPTRQEPDYFEPDPTRTRHTSTRPDPSRPDIYNGNQKLQLIVTIITIFILQIYYVNVTKC